MRHGLFALHAVLCCLSLVMVGIVHHYFPQMPWFAWERAGDAAAISGAFAVVAWLLFRRAAFSFGYFLGFYFFTIIMGYLWLAPFSQLDYDHRSAAASAFAAGIAFLAPALLHIRAMRRATLSPRLFGAVLVAIPVAALAVVAIGSAYNFRLVAVSDIYRFRDAVRFPGWMGYALGTMSTSLIPFAFAGFVERRQGWRAAACLLLLLALYPLTLSKLALFAPFWLLLLLALSSRFEARTAAILSLLLPIAAGIISLPATTAVFSLLNFRMVAIPSMSLDVYGDFFSSHPLTHFCQVRLLAPLVDCPYSAPLGEVMRQAYRAGSWNAFLFATEGIASVGPLLSPLVALAAGMLIALANAASAGLPPRFVILSSGVLVQTLINVPLTTAVLTYGAGLLVLLWYVTPRRGLPTTAADDKDVAERDARRMGGAGGDRGGQPQHGDGGEGHDQDAVFH